MGRERAKPNPKTYEGRLAIRIGELLESSGLTPLELADKCGIGKTTVYNWLSGRNTPPVSDLPKLARALSVEVGDILPPK